MNNFQKAILCIMSCWLLIIWYYFLVVLPEHNQVIAELNKKEVLLKEREQDQVLKDKELEMQQKITQAEQDRIAELQRDCEKKWTEFKREYDNVFSVYFNEYLEECYVRFYNEDNELQEGPMKDMWTIKKKEPIIPLYWKQPILKWVNFRTLPTIDAPVIQEIDPTNTVNILWSREINWDLRYNISFYWKEGRISSVWFWQ